MADGRTARPGHVTPERALCASSAPSTASPHPPHGPALSFPFILALRLHGRAARAFKGNRKWRAQEGRAGTIENKERWFEGAARETPFSWPRPSADSWSHRPLLGCGGRERRTWRGVVRRPPRRLRGGCPQGPGLWAWWPTWGGGPRVCSAPPSPPAPGDIDVPPRRRLKAA